METLPLAFTFFSVGRTAPTILTLVIAAYLLLRRRDRPATWLGLYCFLLGIFNLSFLFAYSIQDPRAGFAWIPACAIGLAAVARLQFAYSFPDPSSLQASGVERITPKERSRVEGLNRRWRLEQKIVLTVATTGALGALLDYVLRSGSNFIPLFPQYSYGSQYSSPYVPAVTALCYLWSIVVSLRMALRLRSHNQVAFRAALKLAAIPCAELAVSAIYLFSWASLVDKATLATLSNIAVLLILAAYVVVYASAARQRTGFMHRLVGISLVSILTLLALASLWLRDSAFTHLQRRVAATTALVESTRDHGIEHRIFAAQEIRDDTNARLSIQDGFWLFAREQKSYFALAPSSANLSNAKAMIVAYPYAELRGAIHAFAFPMAAMMLVATLAIGFGFPILFRASLIAPLRALTADMEQIYSASRKNSRGAGALIGSGSGARDEHPDEIAALRQAFRQMTGLLEQARAGMPEYAAGFENVRQVALGEPRRIPLGDAVLAFRSASMQLVVESVERLRSFQHPVLITGETGTGKEMIARLLHAGPGQGEASDAKQSTGDAGRPFVAVNCATLPESLWESEIFGHRRGAFTDARSDRAGRIAEAGRGTLFFDEIGEIPLSIQAKMLRLLQELEFVPLGADKPVRAHCRFVFATHRDLGAMVAAGEFRQDLLYRIQVFQVALPPLRDRAEDIRELVPVIIERFAAQHGTALTSIDPGVFDLLAAHLWPGNIRELENNILRAIAFASGDTLLPEHFPALREQARATAHRKSGDAVAIADPDIAFEDQVRRFSRSLIEQALDLADGNKSEAARILGLKRTTLRNRMRDLGLS